MGKQEERSARSRQKLLDAMRELIQEQGIEHIGVRDLAARAGVTTGTFYYHFKSKGEIIAAIYEGRDARFFEVLRRLESQPPYRDAILSFFCDFLVSQILEDGVKETLQRMFLFKVRVSPKGSQMYEGVMALIEKGKAAGEFDPDCDTQEMMHTLFLVHRGIVYDWCVTDESIRPALAEQERRIMARILDTYRPQP